MVYMVFKLIDACWDKNLLLRQAVDVITVDSPTAVRGLEREGSGFRRVGNYVEGLGWNQEEREVYGGILFLPEKETGMDDCYHAGWDINQEAQAYVELMVQVRLRLCIILLLKKTSA